MGSTEPELYHPVSLNREYLAGRLLERFADRHTGMWVDFSMENRVRIREECLALLPGLEESLATGSPAFLLHQACWLRSRLLASGFPENTVRAFFSVFRDVLATELPQDYRKQSAGFARKMLTTIKGNACPEKESNLPAAAASFLARALDGDDAGAAEEIEKARAEGREPEEIYLGIFDPALKETGKLWEKGRITIAQEHHASEIVRRIMARLRASGTSGRKTGRRKGIAVAACVGEELHEIGIRMVADLLEKDGWTVYFVGANTPPKSILDAVKKRDAGVVALSITLPSRLPDLRYLIRELRACPDTAGVRIIVGGLPFTVMPDLWQRTGADASASNAREAVAAASRFAMRREAEAFP